MATYRNALIYQRKFFRRAMKNRLAGPSEICAIEFKREFRQLRIFLVLATIAIDRSIVEVFRESGVADHGLKKDRQPLVSSSESQSVTRAIVCLS